MSFASADQGEDKSLTTVKLVILGETGVGKTQFILAADCDDIEQSFDTPMQLPRSPSTIGVDFRTRNWPVYSARTFKVQMWDTAGQERFHAMTPNSLRHSEIICVMFDLTDRETLDMIPKRWLKQINEYRTSVGFENVLVLLIGNKCDMTDHRAVTFNDGERFARQNDMRYAEVTALKRRSVYIVINDALFELHKLHQSRGSMKELEQTMGLAPKIESKRSGCC